MVEFRHSFLLNFIKKHRLNKNSVTLPVDLTPHSYKKCEHDQEIPQSHQKQLKERPQTYQSQDTRKTNKVKRPALSSSSR